MRRLGRRVKAEFSNELAAALSGAAMAAVAGILLGGAMKPQLIFDGRPLGPQMFAAGGGARSSEVADTGASYASYKGALPTYVTGTDYLQGLDEPHAATTAAPPSQPVRSAKAAAPAAVTQATYAPDPRPVVVYPSEAGGRSYDASSVEPAPPQDATPAAVG